VRSMRGGMRGALPHRRGRGRLSEPAGLGFAGRCAQVERSSSINRRGRAVKVARSRVKPLLHQSWRAASALWKRCPCPGRPKRCLIARRAPQSALGAQARTGSAPQTQTGPTDAAAQLSALDGVARDVFAHDGVVRVFALIAACPAASPAHTTL
jgi:hypothetical protein